MLTPFPGLLTFAIVAPFLLRLAAALVLGYTAYVQITRKDELGGGIWLWLGAIAGAAAALSLLLGYYTQLGALAGVVLSIIYIVYAKRYPRAVPMCRGEYILILIICLSLMLSGAGWPAFDIRL